MNAFPHPDGAESPIPGLFAREVPEIASGVVEIRAHARVPGRRAKVAVMSNDPDLDPVGACVGPEAVRIRRIVAALEGERVDIVPWVGSPARRIKLALAPATVARIELDEDARRARVTVHANERAATLMEDPTTLDLACRLTGWYIDVTIDDGPM